MSKTFQCQCSLLHFFIYVTLVLDQNQTCWNPTLKYLPTLQWCMGTQLPNTEIMLSTKNHQNVNAQQSQIIINNCAWLSFNNISMTRGLMQALLPWVNIKPTTDKNIAWLNTHFNSMVTSLFFLTTQDLSDCSSLCVRTHDIPWCSFQQLYGSDTMVRGIGGIWIL